MRRTVLVLAAVLSFSLWAYSASARAGEDPVAEAVRALLDGARGDEARAEAERVLTADPAAAVRAFLAATETTSKSGVLTVPHVLPPDRVALPEPTSVDGAHGSDVVRIYDVRDLTQGRLTAGALAERLRSIVGTRLSVTVTESGAIVARAPADEHDLTAEFLDRLRRAETTFYEIDTRLIVAPMTATVGTQAMRARPGEVVDLENPSARLEEWVRSGDVRVLAAPRVSCLGGQTAAMQIGRQISFVQDFDVEIAQTAFVADPIIGIVWDGVLAEFTAWPNDDEGIQLSLEVAVSDVEMPMPTFTTSLGVFAEPVTIQIPSFVKTEISRSLVVEDGGSALVRLADGPDVRRLLLLTVRRVELDAGSDEER